jgi:hypothetical protein
MKAIGLFGLAVLSMIQLSSVARSAPPQWQAVASTIAQSQDGRASYVDLPVVSGPSESQLKKLISPSLAGGAYANAHCKIGLVGALISCEPFETDPNNESVRKFFERGLKSVRLESSVANRYVGMTALISMKLQDDTNPKHGHVACLPPFCVTEGPLPTLRNQGK